MQFIMKCEVLRCTEQANYETMYCDPITMTISMKKLCNACIKKIQIEQQAVVIGN